LQAVKSGVESLRSVLANNPTENNNNSNRNYNNNTNNDNISNYGERSGEYGLNRSDSRSSVLSSSSSGTTETQKRRSSTSTTRSRSGSGSWSSFLPPSLSGKHLPKDVAGSITDSVTESIKSLGNGLKLGQLAEGLGLNGSVISGHGVNPRRDQHQQQQQNTGPYLNNIGGQASRSRVWIWGGQDTSRASPTEMQGGDMDPALRVGSNSNNRRDMIRTGSKTEEAAKETAALLAKVREQQDLAMERAKRMPEVQKMAQRYQDSWTEIHNHTSRNSEKADNADEILEKVIELCMRHAKSSMQLAEESRDLKDLDESLDEMVTMSENIQKKLVGLEAMIEKLENEAEVLSLAEWKKTKTIELDKYMESKRKELWDKAELLSNRSQQFQKEEAARKLKLYQNKFQTDMETFRRIQEEKVQDLWKIAAETEDDTREAKIKNPLNHNTTAHPSNPETVIGNTPLAATDLIAVHAVVIKEQEEEKRREKEDLDDFLGPATESDTLGDEDKEESEEDDEKEDDILEDEDIDEDEDSEDEDEEEEESESEDDLDPIARARKARALAAASRAKDNAIGSTISAFSALSNPSTTSVSKP
ncbi:hypothetical protein BGZ46_003344, partial [Entomortierella lignicola]